MIPIGQLCKYFLSPKDLVFVTHVVSEGSIFKFDSTIYIGLKFAVNILFPWILEPIYCIPSEVQLNLFVQLFQSITVVVPASETLLTMFRGQTEGKNKTQVEVNVHNRW